MDRDERVVEFVRLVFKALSEHPEKVVITLEERESNKIINVEADSSDYSRFVGKGGVIISSVRKLIFSIAGDDKCLWTVNIPESK